MSNNSSHSSPFHFSQALLKWFDEHGRQDLPWQKAISPYRVWVSEIMLQQTQVDTVIPYYLRFMKSFPSVNTLADASEDDVLAHWSGLGYYARARNLHKTAKLICEQYRGTFPNTVEALNALPGIGRSTAGAITAIAHKQQAAILDGNVKRVLARFHAVPGWPGKTNVSNTLWEHAEQHTPAKRTADYTQAIMDLGATLCTRSKPQCTRCPMQSHCAAFNEHLPTDFPGKKPKVTIPTKTAVMVIAIKHNSDEILLEKRPPSGIWGGLWSLPEFSEASSWQTDFEQHYGLTIKQQNLQTELHHQFSHYKLQITPFIVRVTSISQQPKTIMEGKHRVWYKQQQLEKLGLPAPIRKLLTTVIITAN